MQNNDHRVFLKNIKFVRNRREILRDISWEIRSGEHWVVLGANGSGKTTLLQILAGYLWPTSGEVSILGQRFGEIDLRELRKQIGWVGSFLQVQVPPAQKPLDFIVSGKYATLGIFDKPGDEDYEQARELAARLGCEKILDSTYAVLSQGEKQRLLIARALIHNPRLIILDEPCNGLDLVSREHLLQTLEGLGRMPGGPTMILVTHHLEEIMPVFTNVFMIKAGQRAAIGRKSETLRRELLTEIFGIAIEAGSENGRYWSKISNGSH